MSVRETDTAKRAQLRARLQELSDAISEVTEARERAMAHHDAIIERLREEQGRLNVRLYAR